MILKNILFLAIALSIIPAAQAKVSKTDKAKDMSCIEFLTVDYETIPVVIGPFEYLLYSKGLKSIRLNEMTYT
ncbi:hypothetical protein HWQ46_20155 [Shewanella sp. D64]|uniref:hypothetical protein n=1 Tax=unclassified Shewanella TaxID=196818 RepID=UPI0022BA6C0B|nr:MULTISPECIES: hypothetical protein [unclassified Shewanella]MEC4727853.1 hypothetical protein [Shewanella sp. D64]MEC4739390.1 hypothetical protein [Shewanella sp. E94]WBJ96956.1 hypothetical protein HWQ47_07540 [Shewanella sp. MTB7]